MLTRFKVIKDFDKLLKAGDGFQLGIGLYLGMARLLPEYFMEIQPEGKVFSDDLEYIGEVRIPDIGELYVTSHGYALKATYSAVPANILRLILKPISAGTRFNDDWDYTGEYRIPDIGEYVAYYNGEVEKNAHKYHLISKFHIIKRRKKIYHKAKEFFKFPKVASPTKSEIIWALEGSIRHWEDIVVMVAMGIKSLPINGEHCPLCQLFRPAPGDTPSCLKCPLLQIGHPCMDKNSTWATFRDDHTVPHAVEMIRILQKCKDELVGVKITKCTFIDKGNGTKL